MKLALIAPISWLATSEVTNYQLMLPQLLQDQKYADHYRKLCKRSDQYVILDNGAAEGQDKFSNAQLVGIAIYAQVNEVVVPDVLRDQVETLNRMEQFFKDIEGDKLRNDAFNYDDVRKLKFMGVAQGRTLQEVKDCIDIMMELHGERLHTIALPRHLIETTEDMSARIDLSMYIFNEYTGPQGGIQVHCLGAAPTYNKEMLLLGQLGTVRGMDTSMPYNYAYQGVEIDSDTAWEIKRPPRYFSRPARNFDNTILHHNIGVMKRWANGAE